MNNLIGQSIGRYHIVEQLGAGGMAYVYKAYDTRLERNVAIKVIRNDLFGNSVIERILKRFEREAKAMAHLSHPNIVKVLDYGEHDDSPYLVMELISGGTLKQLLGKPMLYTSAVRLLEPVGRALAYAHSENILHRDVKPSNILITSTGEPILTDFGIAKLLDSDDGQTLTGTGVGIGTPEYMAPEQGLGKPVDGRTDVYSLGIVFYELITGRKPFAADTPLAVLLKQVNDPFPMPGKLIPDLPDDVDHVIFKAMAKDPADRYQSMNNFVHALNNLEKEKEPLKGSLQQLSEVSDEKLEPDGTFIETAFDEQKNKDTEVNLIPDDQNQKANSEDFKGINEPLPVPDEPVLPPLSGDKTISKRKNKKFWQVAAVSFAGVILLLMIIGFASGWFAAVMRDTGSIEVSEIDEMTMVYVPAGNFIMGSPDGVGNYNEHPQHTVYLDAYWIDKTEVTNNMYKKCVDAGSCTHPASYSSNTRDSYYENSSYDNYPVTNVTWDQANAFCYWAGKHLPTEAQWEKAARGTDGSSFPWGNDPINESLANYGNLVGDTMEVGSYPSGASPYGALDMAGNVWEWVADYYIENEYYLYLQNPKDNPLVTTDSKYRSLRGGSWQNGSNSLMTAYRCFGFPNAALNNTGFRCAMPAE